MSAAGDDPGRDRILGRVRDALAKSGVARDQAVARANAEAYVAAHAQGPRPRMPDDLVARFMQRATDMESTVARIADRREIPASVARYLDGLELAPALAAQRSRQGVCWPELADLDWAGAGLAIEETGTLVLLSGALTPTGTMLLPDTHVAIVSAARIVAGMEEAFALVRSERDPMPRAVNLVSGPSRTGDIEQTIVLGAHGPYRVHILVVDH
jgi:L-lactate dehydrogenase complex protein LldG